MLIDSVSDKVPNITISLNKEEKKIFEDLCKKETRGPSAQVKHMMKFYIKNQQKQL